MNVDVIAPIMPKADTVAKEILFFIPDRFLKPVGYKKKIETDSGRLLQKKL